MSFRVSILQLAPRWLNGMWSSKLLLSWGQIFDNFAAQLKDGVKARLPEYAPEDALGFIGNDRSIERGSAESSDNYRTRLIGAIVANKRRGSGKQLLRQLAGFYADRGDPALSLVGGFNSYVWHEYDWDAADAVKTVTTGGWNWDALTTARWWRGWVIIDGATLGYEGPVPFGTGGGVFDDGELFGITGITESEVVSLQRLVQRWKPANVHAMRIIMTLTANMFERTLGAIDPADLTLTGFWNDFDGGTWEGVASAGASSGKNFVAGSAPAVGANFGSHASADFNGTTHYLVATGHTVATFLSQTSYFIQILFEADAAAAPHANPYAEPLLFGDDGGNVYVSFTSAGVRAGHYDNASFKVTTPIPCTTGQKHCVQVWYDGSKIWCRLDGGAPESVTAGNIWSAGMAGVPRTGTNFNTSTFFNGRIAQILTSQIVHNNIKRISLRGDAQVHYSCVAANPAIPLPAGNYDDPENRDENAAYLLSGGEEPA